MKFLKKRKSLIGREFPDWLLGCRGWLYIRQCRLAEELGRRTQYWNKSSWIVALVVFILLFGGCCLYLCVHAFGLL